MRLSSLVLFSLLVCLANQRYVYTYEEIELNALMELKASLDPDNHYLSSWDINAGGHPCSGSTTFFEGVACNEIGQVSNISLQGKGLSGMLSPAISGLKHLTGLYLHYNSLHGEIPREVGYLTQLTDLYLDVNNLSGDIPPEIGNILGLQVLQLCYNELTGSIPKELGSLNKLSVLALQSNHLSGAIPASLGELGTLVRVDLSFNQLFGSIPTKLADAPLLQVLDVRNNTLSGNVSPVLKRLDKGFLYENNLGLCGIGFPLLAECSTPDDINPGRPESVGVGPARLPTRDIPESVYLDFPCNQSHCSGQSKSMHSSVVVGSILVTIALSAVGVFAFTQYRRRKTQHGAAAEMHDFRLSTDQGKGLNGKNGSPLASLEYTRGWDPLANNKYFNAFRQEIIQSFRFNLEEVEAATQYFSEATLLGKNNFCATYKGILRDGSVVAIKSIGKTSCKSEESEFLKGLNMLSSLSHENLVRLRGFCCSKSRGECFLIYDFVPNGSLLHYLDASQGDSHILEWSARVSIVKGIAKGIAYLHSYKVNKSALIHQNISAEKVLIDQRFNPQLSDSGLYKLLTNDIIFSALKARAAMGYIAPEYTTTGRFTDKSDVYAFGVIVLQIISGKRRITSSIRVAAEFCRFQDFIDSNLNGRYFEYEAAKLAKIALSCTHESPIERPSMNAIVQELGNFTSCF